MVSNKILQSMREFDRIMGRKTEEKLQSSPWIRSLDEKQMAMLMAVKQEYPLASSVYDLVKMAVAADDLLSVERLMALSPPITWSKMHMHTVSSSMCKLIGCTYKRKPSLVPEDDTFISMVRAGRLDLVEEQTNIEMDVDKYETPGISSTMLEEKVPIYALEWLITNEFWDGTPLARAITMDRYEELGSITPDEVMMGIILHYDAYNVYRHFKSLIMKHPHLVRMATGRSRQDMLSMYPIIIHAIDDPELTVEDVDTMMGAALGTNLEQDVWNKAKDLHMMELVDKYSDRVK